MAKTKKRILALVLTLAMVFTALAVTAVADEPEHSDECTIDATATCTCNPKVEDAETVETNLGTLEAAAQEAAEKAAPDAYDELTPEQQELDTNADKLGALNEALAEPAAAAGAYEAAPLSIDADKTTISVGGTTNLVGEKKSSYYIHHRWTSSDTNVATVATVSGTTRNATVTGVSAGTVTITHEWYDLSWDKKGSETIQITVNDSGGSTTESYSAYVYMSFVNDYGNTLTPDDLAKLGYTGLQLNGSGWFTVGEIKNATSVAAGNGADAATAKSQALEKIENIARYTKNGQVVNASIDVSSSEITWKMTAVSNGADNYQDNGWCWHLDATLKVSMLRTYTVQYLDADTGNALAGAKTGGAIIDTAVTENAIAITGYVVSGDETQSITIANDPSKNVITFHYTECTHPNVVDDSDWVIDKKPTCTEEGSKHIICPDCDAEFTKSIPVDPTAHPAEALKYHAAVSATCVVPGKVEYWHCTHCEKNFSDAVGTQELTTVDTGLATHTMGPWIEDEGADTHSRNCSFNIPKHKETQPHTDWDKWVDRGNWTETRTCPDCHATQTRDIDKWTDPKELDQKPGEEGDGIPDKFQIKITYKSADTATGTVAPAEQFVTIKNADGTPAETGTITFGAEGKPAADYAFDTWTSNDITIEKPNDAVLAQTSEVTVTTAEDHVYEIVGSFDTDKIGPEDPEGTDPNKPGDGIPDKYQAVVTYQINSATGTWEDDTTDDQVYVFTLKEKVEETGEWVDADPTPTLGETLPSGMKPEEGYLTFGNWNHVISADTVVTGSVTYIYSFRAKSADHPFYFDANGGSWEEVASGYTLNPEKNVACAMVSDGGTVNEITPAPTAPECEDEGYKYEFAGWAKERATANWNFENLIYEDNLRVYAKWNKVKDTLVPIFSAKMIVNCQDENGTSLDYKEITLTNADWSYTPDQTITVGSDKYIYEGITSYSPAKALNGTAKNGGTVVLILNYTKDNWDAEDNSTTGGDGIPDKYQVVVNYKSSNTQYGTVKKSSEVITLKDNDGKYAATGSIKVGDTAACTSLSRVYFNNWTITGTKFAEGTVTTNQTLNSAIQVEGGKEYTITANFGRSSSSGNGGTTIKDPEVPLGGLQLNKDDHFGPGVKFCVNVFRQSQEWRWKAGRILA